MIFQVLGMAFTAMALAEKMEDMPETWRDASDAMSSDGTTILCHFGVRCSGPLGLGACECLEGDQKHLRGHSPRRTADGDSPWVSAGTSEASEASNDGRQLAGPNSTGSKTKSRRSELLGKFRVRCHCGVVCQWGVHNYGRIKVCNGPLFCRSCFPSSPAYGSVGGVR
ncbi:unnamed protein product [Durusdinium trenchii]|uniref:Uncharacterized protein n=2 Tax=Durusdinium trenchii TaxID=1381693 RepID=A0ABP0S7U0_9DINO